MKSNILFKHIIFFLILFYCNIQLLSQSANLGNPSCINFKKNQYKGGTQTWDIVESKNGIVWFANNYGLLEYNGSSWVTYPITNGTIIRSVALSNDDNKVYVGGQGDFGYFEPDYNGNLTYQSIKKLLQPSDQNFGDIWDIKVLDNKVYYRSDNQIFCYFDNKIQKILNHNYTILYFGVLNNYTVFQDDHYNFYKIDHNEIIKLEYLNNIKGQVSSIINFAKDTVLITTYKNGIFSLVNNSLSNWKTSDDEFLKKNIIFTAEYIQNKKIALGTVLNGIVIIDENKKILQHINKKSGLQNNTILSLYLSSSNVLWAGTDNGIDLININSPFTTFYPDGDLQGTGYTIGVNKNKIYFGTNTGLYYTDWKNYYSPLNAQKFSIVKNSEGQVWSLNNVGNQFLMGHHEGAFQIENNTATKIADLKGVWKFININPTTALAGHYNGLALFDLHNNQWTLKSRLGGFSESSRILMKNLDGTFWMAHPYHGLFNIQINTENNTINSKYYNGLNGLPNSLNNNIFSLNKKLVFGTNSNLFDYLTKSDSFLTNKEFEKYIDKDEILKYLYQDKNDNIWYVTNKNVGCLKVDNQPFEKKINKQVIPELTNKLTEGFQFILPVDSQNVFFATEKGFINFDQSKYDLRNKKIRVLINNISLKGEKDSILYGGHLMNNLSPIVLSCNQNSLKISYSSPDYPENDLIQYTHFLEGADLKWSEWSNDNSLQLSNLPFGIYTFILKARNHYGEISDEIRYKFKILAPWYRTNYAYFIYFILFFSCMYYILRRQQRKFSTEKKSIVQLHEQREAVHLKNVSQSEENLHKLQREYLEAEIRHKNQELVSATLHITQKNEMMNTIRLALNKLNQKSSKNTEIHQEIENILKMVQHDAKIDSDWDNFIQSFDNIHNDFFKRLKEKHPQLSSNEYKLCAYLRINLTSKEISKLMNISTRSVETNRYRLRKKLDLANEINLNDYFSNF